MTSKADHESRVTTTAKPAGGVTCRARGICLTIMTALCLLCLVLISPAHAELRLLARSPQDPPPTKTVAGYPANQR